MRGAEREREKERGNEREVRDINDTKKKNKINTYFLPTA